MRFIKNDLPSLVREAKREQNEKCPFEPCCSMGCAKAFADEDYECKWDKFKKGEK